MRKSLVLLLALLLVVSISICACKKDEEPVDTGSEATTTAPAGGEESSSTPAGEDPEPALKPLGDDTYNVAESDWTKNY